MIIIKENTIPIIIHIFVISSLESKNIDDIIIVTAKLHKENNKILINNFKVSKEQRCVVSAQEEIYFIIMKRYVLPM